jgi:hypothetical protein
LADDGGDLGAHRHEATGAGSHGRGLKFLAWLYAQGDKMADELDDVQMPDKLVDAMQPMWSAEIVAGGGRSVFIVGT